ncbi:tyrosine-type recombinase/integrase [Pseudonocardia xishanensis]|uniref:Site-specific recombinase XerD n=1 Tax=Pseudonocardia xishanensis TaxID=630995 RepID=A0ABP8RTN4_9PSEU
MARRQRGEIEVRSNGSLRVRVYAGIDPLSGKRHYLVETVPAGKDARKEAEKVQRRLATQVDEQRNPRTKATVDQLLDRYLELLEVEDTTRDRYEQVIRVHIRPRLGALQVARLDGELLDSYYAILRRCRRHCNGRVKVDHSTDEPHECDAKCSRHVCKPLASATIRKIHFCLSGALARAVRWRWIAVNPLGQAEPPRGSVAEPDPPTAAQAAKILESAFAADLWWACFLWLAMVTGARRGELCALSWDRLDLDRAVLTIRSSIAQRDTHTWEKDTKTHQQRRIHLDADTVTILKTYRGECQRLAESAGITIRPDGRLFSPAIDHSTWLRPSSISNRYVRMCRRLGWDMNLHQLRHYSATELIAAGVDVRTVAGRLGHGGGGSTTLRVYTAWVAESDQRAMKSAGVRMPAPPAATNIGNLTARTSPADCEGTGRARQIAADLRAAMTCGALQSGDRVPTIKELADRYSVAVGTAHVAIDLLRSEGRISVSRGKRATVAASPRTKT